MYLTVLNLVKEENTDAVCAVPILITDKFYRFSLNIVYLKTVLDSEFIVQILTTRPLHTYLPIFTKNICLAEIS